MKNPDPPYPSSPGLTPARFAASELGLTTETFVRACERGDIPIRLERLGGRGLRFVRLAELKAYLGTKPLTQGEIDDPFNP